MNNIVIIGFDYKKIKCLAKKLSDILGMYFLDIYDYIQYDIANKEEMIKTCGIEYYMHQEGKIVSNSFTFENMILNIRYNQFYQYKKNKDMPQHNIVIYLQTDEKNISKRILNQNDYFDADSIGNLLTFENRDKFLETNSNIIIKYNTFNEKNIINKILTKLNEVGIYEA